MANETIFNPSLWYFKAPKLGAFLFLMFKGLFLIIILQNCHFFWD
jgi:hypothetical protein